MADVKKRELSNLIFFLIVIRFCGGSLGLAIL